MLVARVVAVRRTGLGFGLFIRAISISLNSSRLVSFWKVTFTVRGYLRRRVGEPRSSELWLRCTCWLNWIWWAWWIKSFTATSCEIWNVAALLWLFEWVTLGGSEEGQSSHCRCSARRSVCSQHTPPSSGAIVRCSVAARWTSVVTICASARWRTLGTPRVML